MQWSKYWHIMVGVWQGIKMSLDSNPWYSLITWSLFKGTSILLAFTDCDTVSAFVGQGKCLDGRHGMSSKLLQKFFTVLVQPKTKSQSYIHFLEQFAVIMYDRSSITVQSTNKSRPWWACKTSWFSSKSCVGLDIITSATNTFTSSTRMNRIDSSSTPNWSTLSPIAECCQELQKCDWRRTSPGNCKWYRSDLSCTALCSCNCQEKS